MPPKKNNFIQKIEAEMEAKYNAIFNLKMDMLMQMGQDAGMIAANEVFKMGAGRAPDFCVAYIEAMNTMAKLVVEDQLEDNEFWYAKSKIDEKIRAIVGEENFVPWERRYKTF